MYGDKLAELKGVGEPVGARAAEASKRPEVIAAFQQSLVLCRKFLDQKAAGDEKYAHIGVLVMWPVLDTGCARTLDLWLFYFCVVGFFTCIAERCESHF